jgi:xanthine/CO dehydrogenase XdhC/CoxF family maturation factor
VRNLIHTENRSIIIADYNDISPVAELLSGCEGCFIATHGHEWDKIVLSQILKTAPNLSYIGMIGSKVKVRTILTKLKADGFDFPEGLHTPVGLRIGGDTAAEIAVSIAAEIIAVKNGLKVPHMKINFDDAGPAGF